MATKGKNGFMKNLSHYKMIPPLELIDKDQIFAQNYKIGKKNKLTTKIPHGMMKKATETNGSNSGPKSEAMVNKQ